MPERSDCGAYLWAGEERTAAKNVEKHTTYARFVPILQHSYQKSEELLASLVAYTEGVLSSYAEERSGFVSAAQRKAVYGDANRMILKLEAVRHGLAALLISLGHMEHELLALRSAELQRETDRTDVAPDLICNEWSDQRDGIVRVCNELGTSFVEAIAQAADLENDGANASFIRFSQVLSVWTERVKLLHISDGKCF